MAAKLFAARPGVQEAAAKSKDLQRILAETSSAATLLAQNQSELASLQAAITASDARVKDLDLAAQKEQLDHARLRDSRVKRFAYSATGRKAKFDAQARAEEAEYVAALQLAQRETDANAALRAQLHAAHKPLGELQREVARRAQAEQDLEALYGTVFNDGTWALFPGEVAARKKHIAAQEAHRAAVERAAAEEKAAAMLGEVQQLVSGAAVKAIDEALHYSRRHPFNNGVVADMLEHDALGRARMAVVRARMKLIDVRELSPLVGDLPEVVIGQGSGGGGPFRSWGTDDAGMDDIRRSQGEVQRAVEVVDDKIAAAAERRREVDVEVKVREAAVEEARAALQMVREKVFASFPR
ncbi:hypothetical protein B0T26DRAFT_753713 [Lasiosphaeria miniovina]|uniref:Uncharacterized protein n=1 Tax=Lasiosphaeria miniovina TaxID=1954250 RepID=A0AA40AD90_9PEZI|nr:uncharacterized protein B0T26DRAFT_753713 [Lasiosphaeria miniovina]KAK0713619.1 hypothetical protein B0T26DRAFT_753713 [Lasiosphaeria miniovina]